MQLEREGIFMDDMAWYVDEKLNGSTSEDEKRSSCFFLFLQFLSIGDSIRIRTFA
jgi:hypothetical protein